MYRAVEGGTAPVTGNTCAPPPVDPSPFVPNAVTPGAFCAQDIAGWYGRSAAGLLMQCKTSPTDPRLRWRAV
jgi:hypothetical protein